MRAWNTCYSVFLGRFLDAGDYIGMLGTIPNQMFTISHQIAAQLDDIWRTVFPKGVRAISPGKPSRGWSDFVQNLAIYRRWRAAQHGDLIQVETTEVHSPHISISFETKWQLNYDKSWEQSWFLSTWRTIELWKPTNYRNKTILKIY